MGCRASKAVQTEHAPQNNTDATCSTQKEDPSSSPPTDMTQPATNERTSSSSSTIKPSQTAKMPSQTTTASFTTSTSLRSSDRVYKLLWKASQRIAQQQKLKSHPKTSNNNNSSSSNAATNTTNSNFTAPVWDETAVLQAMSPQAASYRNPDTQASPLHLAVQLMDGHSWAAAVAQTPTATLAPTTAAAALPTQQQQQQLKSSALFQVISELIKAYPEAVHTPDIYGYIPLHYAIAPRYNHPANAQGNNNTSMPSTPNSSKKSKRGKSPVPSKEPSQPNVTNFNRPDELPASIWPLRTSIVRLLLQSDTTQASYQYLSRNDVTYHHHHNLHFYSTNHKQVQQQQQPPTSFKCSPLYRVLQMIPDDPSVQKHPPTVEYVHVIMKYMMQSTPPPPPNEPTRTRCWVGRANDDDGDRPLALLYRRFTRQFDVAEQFFTGDNSRPQVVAHRHYYKMAASNTWKLIELLLLLQQQQYQQQQQQNSNNQATKKSTYRIVHFAVQGETPPDLLRYIVETNAEELTIPDEHGNLPLHYAARYRPPQLLLQQQKQHFTGADHKSSLPAFYSKYVMDELLYKYPEAAAIPDRDGSYPLLLAVQSGKPWIGGGIKSLYDAYPEAMGQINAGEYPVLQRALLGSNVVDQLVLADQNAANHNTTSKNNTNMDDAELLGSSDPDYHEEKKVGSPQLLPPEKKPFDIIRDEPHDAIMLVQDEHVDISEVVTSMWAHEEDAGVQMLSCIAIRRLLHTANDTPDHVLRVALSAVPAVVNAMKAHPNEVIVQEKACHTLRAMASADGQREVSFVASGAVAAIVGAMQAHVSDAQVQEEACGALSQILQYGGPDRATVVASVSGLTAMMNAIMAHPSSQSVQREGCRALMELTNYTTTANLPALSKSSNTESLLEQAKATFPLDCTETVDVLLSRLT